MILLVLFMFFNLTSLFSSDLRNKMVYFLYLDRFEDGTTANNYVNNNDPDAARHWPNTAQFGYPGNNVRQLSYDRANNGTPSDPDMWKKFWGGDIQGLTQRIPYLKDLGVGCVYITCPVKQTETQPLWRDAQGTAHPYNAYHGYWMKDFYRIDEHWAGPTKWENTVAGSTGGSEGWAVFQTFVNTALSNNIEIMIDIPINHSNPVDLGYAFDDAGQSKPAGWAGWGEGGAVYQDRGFKGSYTDYYVNGALNSNSDPDWFYHHYGSGNAAINETAFPGYGWSGLGDYNVSLQNSFGNAWSDPSNPSANATVYNYLIGGLKKFIDCGVYNFRIDATKHAELPFLRKITQELRDYAQTTYGKALYFVGEWYGSGFPAYDGTSGNGGSFSYLDNGSYHHYANFSDYFVADPTANFDFQLSFKIQNVFAQGGSFEDIGNYLTGREGFFTGDQAVKNDWQMNMIANHDMERFQQQAKYYGIQFSTSDARDLHEMAMAFLMTTRGIPMLYYGDELFLYHDNPSKENDKDPYNRLMMPDNFQMMHVVDSSTYGNIHSAIKKLSGLRLTNTAISVGSWTRKWANSDILVFERVDGDKKVLVCMNKGNSSANMGNNGLYTALSAGTYGDFLGGDVNGSSTRSMVVSSSGLVTDLTLNAKEVAVFVAGGSTPTEAKRTVVYIYYSSIDGEMVRMRGGHGGSLVPANYPVRYVAIDKYNNKLNPDTSALKDNDSRLDWGTQDPANGADGYDSLLDWTCAAWPSDWGTPKVLAQDGFGVDPENTLTSTENPDGLHQWKFDADLVGNTGDWFEFKLFIYNYLNQGSDHWESDIGQASTPFSTANHWGRVGYKTSCEFDASWAVLTAL